MKRFLIKTTIVITGLLITISCDKWKWPFGGPEEEYVRWKFINNTGQDIYYNFDLEGERQIMPADKLSPLMSYYIWKGNDPDFYILYDMLVDAPLYIYLDETSDPVKVWKRSEKDLPGKQFYNESSWKLDDSKANFYVWIFEITPEDLE